MSSIYFLDFVLRPLFWRMRRFGKCTKGKVPNSNNPECLAYTFLIISWLLSLFRWKEITTVIELFNLLAQFRDSPVCVCRLPHHCMECLKFRFLYWKLSVTFRIMGVIRPQKKAKNCRDKIYLTTKHYVVILYICSYSQKHRKNYVTMLLNILYFSILLHLFYT
jgi:hypothetical protein